MLFTYEKFYIWAGNVQLIYKAHWKSVTAFTHDFADKKALKTLAKVN